MNAQLQLPVLEPAQRRPEYDNTYLGYEADWIEANILALLDWYTLGNEGRPDEFPLFASSQHDIELARRDEFRNTLRQY